MKHIAAEEGIVLSYRSRSKEARRRTALEYRKKLMPDKSSEYGPPNCADNDDGDFKLMDS